MPREHLCVERETRHSGTLAHLCSCTDRQVVSRHTFAVTNPISGQRAWLLQVKTLITTSSSGKAPAEVTQIAVGRSDSHQIAVGHADGTVSIRGCRHSAYLTTNCTSQWAEHHLACSSHYSNNAPCLCHIMLLAILANCQAASCNPACIFTI